MAADEQALDCNVGGRKLHDGRSSPCVVCSILGVECHGRRPCEQCIRADTQHPGFIGLCDDVVPVRKNYHGASEGSVFFKGGYFEERQRDLQTEVVAQKLQHLLRKFIAATDKNGQTPTENFEQLSRAYREVIREGVCPASAERELKGNLTDACSATQDIVSTGEHTSAGEIAPKNQQENDVSANVVSAQTQFSVKEQVFSAISEEDCAKHDVSQFCESGVDFVSQGRPAVAQIEDHMFYEAEQTVLQYEITVLPKRGHLEERESDDVDTKYNVTQHAKTESKINLPPPTLREDFNKLQSIEACAMPETTTPHHDDDKPESQTSTYKASREQSIERCLHRKPSPQEETSGVKRPVLFLQDLLNAHARRNTTNRCV